MREKQVKYFLCCVKSLLYSIILGLFVAFYLVDYLKTYLQHDTTFSSRYEEVNSLECPTLIICVQDGYNPKMMQKFNFKSIYDLYQFDKSIKNTTMVEMLSQVSYLYGQDYEINVTAQIDFQKDEIITFAHGMCQKLQPKEEMKVDARIFLDIKWKLKSEVAKDFVIYLVSNNSWQGLTDDILPYYKPSKVILNLADPERVQVPMSTIVKKYKNGNLDFATCMETIIRNLDCQTICAPFYLFSAMNIPACKTFSEFECVDKYLYSTGDIAKQNYGCHKPSLAKLFNPRPNSWKRYLGDDSSQMYFYFESLFILYKEEMYVINDSQLIGTVGGSLGLFLGFSFYSYFSGFFEIVVQKMKGQ